MSLNQPIQENKITKVKSWLKDVSKIIGFYNKRETLDSFEALDSVTDMWAKGVTKFTKADKKDKYLNGYRVDEDSSPVVNSRLHLVKENTTEPYDVDGEILSSLSFAHCFR